MREAYQPPQHKFINQEYAKTVYVVVTPLFQHTWSIKTKQQHWKFLRVWPTSCGQVKLVVVWWFGAIFWHQLAEVQQNVQQKQAPQKDPLWAGGGIWEGDTESRQSGSPLNLSVCLSYQQCENILVYHLEGLNISFFLKIITYIRAIEIQPLRKKGKL